LVTLEPVRRDGSHHPTDPYLDRWLDQAIIGERQPGPVRLVEYDAHWPAQFERIRERLVHALRATATTVEHIGSTAIPGMVAKPIVDVLVTVNDVEDEPRYLPAIVGLGYALRVREDGHRMFRPASRDAHVHVCAEGSRKQRDYLLLGDWLRRSAEDRGAYGRLKWKLATEDWPDVNYYAQAKSPLISQILERAAQATTSRAEACSAPTPAPRRRSNGPRDR
jgi:GrpB-like predicted nucleotidyltransferase (UPF0157 family)